MPGRSYTAGTSYRYGFDGKENDNEVKGTGNQQDYGMRVYDPRIGKFLSVDPITSKYPQLTPYQFASNRPIDGIDLDGLEFLKKNNTEYSISYKPVLNTPNIATGISNASHNTLALVWNGTLGAICNLGKSVNNYLAGGYKEPTGPDPVTSFVDGADNMYRYITRTPFKEQLKGLGDAATDLRTYEILPSLIIAHTFSVSTSPLTSSAGRVPLQGEIFTSNISTRGLAESYAELSTYKGKGYFNANNFIKANNPAFDLISTMEKNVVDVATTTKPNLKISSWEMNKLERLNELRPKGYSGTLQMFVKEGQYTAEQLSNYKKSLNDYITKNGLKNVSAAVDEIPK